MALVMAAAVSAANAQTESQVWDEIVRQGLPCPKVVLAQSRHETGNYTSRLCRGKKNLFGIKHGRRYAAYGRWQDSVTDYKKRISARYCGGHRDHAAYFAFLKRIGYAADKQYVDKLKRYIK